MTEQMIYHPNIAHLETRVSYGTLGILHSLAMRMNDNINTKKNYLLINGGTIVRNCYSSNKSDKEILEAIALDFSQLRHYFETYVSEPGYMLVYFQPGIAKLIPEDFRRSETKPRLEVERLTRIVAASESLKPNVVTKFGENENVTHYGLFVSGIFAYRAISREMLSAKLPRVPKMWMVSHCPIDYFLLDNYPNSEIKLSHTGKILQKKDISEKVFKDDEIPFNRTTYKLFGDKEFIRGACRNRPKALEKLGNINLRLKTEREIIALAKTKLGIDTKTLSWDL